jgi:2-dehydro-3-deoxygluconokinase
MDEARDGGALVSFDLNYRSKLWSPKEAATAMRHCLAKADLIFCSPQEVGLIFDERGTPEQVLEWLVGEFRPQMAVLKLGEEGAVAWHDGAIHRVGVYPTETVDAIGSGDAFVAGFVYGLLTCGIEEALRHGAAVAALKRTIPGDIALVTPGEVDELLLTQHQHIQR